MTKTSQTRLDCWGLPKFLGRDLLSVGSLPLIVWIFNKKKPGFTRARFCLLVFFWFFRKKRDLPGPILAANTLTYISGDFTAPVLPLVLSCAYQTRPASSLLCCSECPGMCRVGIRSQLPHLASRPRCKKRKILRFAVNKPSLSNACQLASTHQSWGAGAVWDSLICMGEGPVKHRPPLAMAMRAPHVAVAARKWPFTPVLRHSARSSAWMWAPFGSSTAQNTSSVMPTEPQTANSNCWGASKPQIEV